MRIFFGVLGDASSAGDTFQGLCRTTAASNPDAMFDLETGTAARLGVAARAFARWDDPSADRSIYLEGEILAIDGRASTSPGATEDELRSISKLFDIHGRGLWDRIDGSFCLLVRDGPTWQIGVDVSGTRAVYWWYEHGVLAFHSHLVDLAPTHPGQGATDPGAIGSFLASGMFPPVRTAFEAIHHLGAGQCLSVSPGGAVTHDYFRMAYNDSAARKSKHAMIDELIDLLSESVGSAWRVAARPVVPLSGGTDSRYIAAEIVRQARDPAQVQTITWGEDRTRIGSDAVVAEQVAAALGARNQWYEKPQQHTTESLHRAIYLSSGEYDHAIHYPNDHLLQVILADSGFRSIFRGDEMFGPDYPLVTSQAAFAANGIVRLSADTGYDGLIDRELLSRMSIEQAAILDVITASLETRSPLGRRNEVHYLFNLRRGLAPYNSVKAFDLEVYTPLIRREVLSWLTELPERFRYGKDLLKAAMQRRFPNVASIPYASRSNLPSWDEVWLRDPRFAGVLREATAAPGWLDTIGARAAVTSRFEEGQTEAGRRSVIADRATMAAGTPSRWREVAKRTVPGQLLRELTLERRAAEARPPYLGLARLAVLHLLIGQVDLHRAALASTRSRPG